MKPTVDCIEGTKSKNPYLDGRISCLWTFWPTRLHPFMALKYILDLDCYVNMLAIYYGICLMIGARTKRHDFCAWWGCYGHCITFGGFIVIHGIFLSIYSGCMERNLYSMMRQKKNLVSQINCYFYLRGVFYFLHLLMYVIQLGGFVHDIFMVHKNQKDEERLRILGEETTPRGTTVRVEGSYYNEMNALNYAILLACTQVFFILWLLILGWTMKTAAFRCNEDMNLPLERVLVKENPLKEEICLMSKDNAKVIKQKYDQMAQESNNL